jgi:hypothetical protein
MVAHAHPFLDWIAATQLGYLASKTRWVFATAQSIHFMGLSILVGAVTILDLRILGVLRRVPIDRLSGLIPLALIGFVVQVVTGVVMFSAEPARYWMNPGFRIKMGLLVIAGLNALWFWLAEHRKLVVLGASESPRLAAKLVAALSIGLWLLVITFGRFLPYLDGLDFPWVPGG